jgi:hypothetical protein
VYSSGSLSTLYPAPASGSNNCGNAGLLTGDDGEAILDAEWASAAAPGANIIVAACADTYTTFGGLIAIENLVNGSNPPAIMSISYGECEVENGASLNAAFSTLYQQAVAEGVSVFVSAGDEGSASCDADLVSATHGLGVSGFASTPYNVAVGGTDFADSATGSNATYWSAINSSTYGSALSYIPEIPWNDSCAGGVLVNYLGFPSAYGADSLCALGFRTVAAGSGGPSACASGSPYVYESLAESAKARLNLPGKRALPEFLTTACATSRTSLCSPPMACGATTTCSAGATPRREALPVWANPADGPARAERHSPRRSWREFKLW